MNPGLGMPFMGSGFGMPGMMPGMMIMSIQVESSPLDNLMSSLMSPLINSLFNPGNTHISQINMPQISSSKNFLNIGYE